MCNKLKCTRCHYEELKGTENYCPICGLNLKGGMTYEEIIKQADSLISESKLNIENAPFDSEVFRRDKETLEALKEVFERTAQEVAVQEQKIFKAKGKCKYPCTLILKTYNS